MVTCRDCGKEIAISKGIDLCDHCYEKRQDRDREERSFLEEVAEDSGFWGLITGLLDGIFS